MIYNSAIYSYIVSRFQDDTIRFEYKIISGMENNIQKCPSPYIDVKHIHVFVEQS